MAARGRVSSCRGRIRTDASRLMRPVRAQPSLHEKMTAGCRGIEPRWPVLETSLIPDRDPGGPDRFSSDNRPQSVRNGRVGEDGLPGRKCSRLESNQHLLRFRQAPSPDRLREQNRGRRDQGRLGRPRASSTIWFSKIIPGRRRDWLPRFICALADFIIRVDLSRSRPRRRLPCRQVPKKLRAQK